VANLFAALVVSRNCFEWIQAYSPLQKLSMMKFLENPNYDFLKLKFPAAILSGVLLVAGLGSFSANKDKLLGVDFTGGDALTLGFSQRVDVGELRATLEKGGMHPGSIQYFNASAGQSDKLLIQVREGDGEKAVSNLRAAFPQANLNQVGLDRVGSQVGAELQERALVSLALGVLGILIYSAIRFEWSFAVAAAIGQVHDVFLALALMALLGRELTLPLVAAFLTIAGYSINDKIVVFDRIREGMHLKEKGSFYEIINRSLNLTLARTLMTGNTMILATLALILFGGPVIHDFSVAMLIGILSGIYSSHFISPPIAWWLGKKKESAPGEKPAAELTPKTA
jgi:SecD/SecF fusion protein